MAIYFDNTVNNIISFDMDTLKKERLKELENLKEELLYIASKEVLDIIDKRIFEIKGYCEVD